MRIFRLTMALVLLTGCSTVSTVPAGPEQHGIPYVLPKGVIPIQVFADANGIGLTIEPSLITVDNEAGQLVAQLFPSPFNNEDIKLAVDPVSGLLTTITSNSDAQLLAIVEEAAKATARLALQNSRASFLATKVVVLDDSFDPLNSKDIDRVNIGLDAAFKRAAQAFSNARRGPLTLQPVSISVEYPDGSALPNPPNFDVSHCKVGICARTQTSLRIRVSLGSATLGSKIVSLPSRQVIAVPVPSTILANQDLTINIKDGIVEKYDLKRDSTILGLVKIPGAILSGLVAGVTENLTAQKSIIDKRKDLAASEEGFAEAIKTRNDAVAANVGETSVKLQTTGDGATTSYSAATLTIYPFSETLTQAISQQIEEAKSKANERKRLESTGSGTSGAVGGKAVSKLADGDLLGGVGKMKPAPIGRE